jgi:Ca2+-binding RTX toxin-like protein
LNKYSQPILQMVGFDGLARLRQTLGTLSADDRQAFGIFLSGTVGTAGVDIYLGDGGDNSFNGKAGDDLMDGGGGKDLLDGGAGDDVLFGRDGNDTLYGGDGNDILNGGAGNDTLHGGTGNNTYLFGKGDGQDVIQFVHDPAAGKLNTLRFNEGVLSSEVALRQVYDNQLGGNNALEVSIAGTTDKVTINGFFYGNNPAAAYNPVQHFQFADGTAWNMAAILERLFAGTPGADTINGTLNGDAIHGGAGNDTLNGLAGDDTLDGGAGNDVLNGGAGNDTYLFGLGAGADTVTEYGTTAGNIDVMAVGEGVAADQLWFRRVGTNLEVTIIGTSDKSTINNWYSGSAYHIEQFRTADGKVLLDSQVDVLVSAMAAFSPPPAGQTTLAPDYQTALAPVLAASWN